MRRWLFLVLLAFVVLSTGCEVRSNVDIHVAGNGGGSVVVKVELDREAARAVPDLSTQLEKSDLVQAGWKVDGPDDLDDGGRVVEVSHGFDTPEEATALMAQLSNNRAPFIDFQLHQDRSLTNVDTTFAGTVDLSEGIAAFGDEGLSQTLGSRLGFDEAELQRNVGVDWAKSFPLSVAVHLPGGNVDRSPQSNDDGEWNINYGQVTSLHASADGANLRPLIYFGAAATTLSVALIVFVVWQPQKYLPQHRKGRVRARDLLAGDPKQAKSVHQ